MVELLSDPSVWASFLTLAVLEIVLGVDNVIFISIAAARLPESQRRRARLLGADRGTRPARRAAFLHRVDHLAVRALRHDPWLRPLVA